MSLSLHPQRIKRYKDIARFLAAAGGAAWLGFGILTSDKPPRRKP